MSQWHEKRELFRTLTDEQKKEYRREYNRQWIKDNPGYDVKWRTEYWMADPAARLLWSSKKRAKAKGLPFDLVKEDIVIPTHCPYLGTELTTHAPRGTDRGSVISLDRIIPELGYVKGNIEVISHQANTMKNNATQEQLVEFAHRVLEKHRANQVD